MRRREFIKTAAAIPVTRTAAQSRKKIAALSTTYHVRSHSDNFITRFLEGYWINEKYYPPPADVVFRIDHVAALQQQVVYGLRLGARRQ